MTFSPILADGSLGVNVGIGIGTLNLDSSVKKWVRLLLKEGRVGWCS